MSVKTNYYLGISGDYGVIDPELINVTILHVTRSGMTYSAGSPAEQLTFVYQDAFGRILFGEPFAGPVSGRPNRNDLERVSVKFKY